MKRIMMVSLLMVMGYFAFSQQRVSNDPTYSVNNYKHPNKAAYAKQHGLDKSTTLVAVSVNQNDNYKQPYSKRSTKRFAIGAGSQDRQSGASYKHPYGL